MPPQPLEAYVPSRQDSAMDDWGTPDDFTEVVDARFAPLQALASAAEDASRAAIFGGASFLPVAGDQRGTYDTSGNEPRDLR